MPLKLSPINWRSVRQRTVKAKPFPGSPKKYQPLEPVAFRVDSSLCIALLSNSQAKSEKKKYASERDFQHIRRNQENISSSIGVLWKDLEDSLNQINRDILEIKFKLGIKNKDE